MVHQWAQINDGLRATSAKRLCKCFRNFLLAADSAMKSRYSGVLRRDIAAVTNERDDFNQPRSCRKRLSGARPHAHWDHEQLA
jgi:hypothetical protein